MMTTARRIRICRIWVWLALALLPLPAGAQVSVTADNPRLNGWWLGDQLVQHLRIDLPPGVVVDASSLPRPRAVEYWLDLQSVTSRDTKTGVELTLRWQNFYSPLEPSLRKVPSSPIALSDGSRAELPGFEFVASPLRPLLASSGPDQLLPDARYRLIDPLPAQAGMAATLLALLAALAALARHQGWWPFHARPARPLTRAWRRMARLGAAPETRLRQELHRGLDGAHGRVLIGPDLSQFITARPEFAALSDRLAGFFAGSEDAFYRKDARGGDGTDLRRLARDLAAVERGRK